MRDFDFDAFSVLLTLIVGVSIMLFLAILGNNTEVKGREVFRAGEPRVTPEVTIWTGK